MYCIILLFLHKKQIISYKIHIYSKYFYTFSSLKQHLLQVKMPNIPIYHLSCSSNHHFVLIFALFRHFCNTFLFSHSLYSLYLIFIILNMIFSGTNHSAFSYLCSTFSSHLFSPHYTQFRLIFHPSFFPEL